MKNLINQKYATVFLFGCPLVHGLGFMYMSQIFEQNWVISATVSVVCILINYSEDDGEKSVSFLFTTIVICIFLFSADVFIILSFCLFDIYFIHFRY